MSHRSHVWLLFLALLCVLPVRVAAQEARQVTGQVLEGESRQPMVGVQVTVRGTSTGTMTNDRGMFTILVPGHATALVFTYVGHRTEEVRLANLAGPVQVLMQPQPIGLEGIVVTALGVEREKRSLGYSVQDVSGDRLNEVPNVNVVNSLKGNVAGVHITEAGPTGGSSRIVIRGASSVAGNNQPLFIIDGVPIDNSAPRNTGFGGIDYGNAAQDIDPNNIETISILKGPNAAALYGSRAQNGAIVITTKSGRGIAAAGLGMSATMSLMASSPLRLPNYQNLYGQGWQGQFRFVDGRGGGVYDHFDESWGPRLDGRLIDQFHGPQQPWVPAPNNVRDFFDTGRELNMNVAVARAGDNSNVRLSITNTNVASMFPGNTINRLGVAVKGGASLTDRLSAEASVNYINQGGENRAGTGYDEDNPMQQFIWFGRQVDLKQLRQFRCQGGEPHGCQLGAQYNWNYNYHNNPYWEMLVNGNEDDRDRVIGHVASAYQVTNWLNVRGQLSRDWYRERRKDWIHHYSLDDSGQGSFNQQGIYRAETNAELLLGSRHNLSPNLQLTATAGANMRRNDFNVDSVTVTRLAFPGIYTVDNAAVTPETGDFESVQEVRSVLASLSMNYAGWLNVDVTGRNDWSSTLPRGNNSYFYPSISSAFVFTDALNWQSPMLSSGKLRASWTRVGNDAAPYQLASVFNAQQGWGGVPMFQTPATLSNPDLKPEETTAWEIGTDLGFLDERVGFVLTYYDSRTKNQILGVQISRASGFTNQVLNAGEMRNYGLELLLSANPVRRERFSWDVTLNWGKNNSQVRELYGDLQTLVLGTYWSLDVEARCGWKCRGDSGPAFDGEPDYYPYGTMFGNGYLRDDQGRMILTAAGVPRPDGQRRVLGNYNPDWNGGIQNRFRFGPAELSVLVDGQKGGNIFSVTNWFGEYAGVLQSTIRGRETDWCDPGIVVEGVLPDGRVNGQDAQVSICPHQFFQRNFGIQESGIGDASYLKLREIRLGYTLPTRFVSRFGFSGGSVALIGRNLAMWTNIDNIDPETAFDASNVQGIEFGQHPTARSIGFSLSIRP
jgi:TonB-linked SusC/RagA family outer membrane protein